MGLWLRPWTHCSALALTAGVSIVLVLIVAAPVLRDPTTQLFGFELAGRHHDPFTVMQQYAAGGVPAPYLQPATDLVGVALTKAMHPVSAYNALILMSFPLAAVLAYAHARHVIGSAAGAAVAALLFALSPFHFAHAAYHVHITQVQWIPLFFLFLWRLLDRPTVRRAVALAVAFVIVAASSFYLGMVTAVTAPIAAAVYVFVRRSSSRPAVALGSAAAALAGALAVLTTAVWMWSPEVLHNRLAFAFPEEAVYQHSAQWWSYLTPPHGHPWLDGLSSRRWQSTPIDQGVVEQQVFLGLSVIALALVPVFPARWSSSRRIVPVAPALAVTAAVAVLFSLPPTLAVGPLSVPMPSAVLYELAPMFRAYARFGVIVSLMVTTLAGAGVAILLDRRSRTSVSVAICLMAAAFFEYVPPVPASRDVLPTSAHRSLAGASDVRLFDCAISTPGATAGVAWLMGSTVMFPGGPLSDCSEPELGAKLAAFGITHLLVRADTALAEPVAGGRIPQGTRLLRDHGDGTILEVVGPKPLVYTRELTGFYPRERANGETWRWMGPRGSLLVVNAADAPVIALLDLELESFGVPRSLQVSVDDGAIGTIAVRPARAWYTVGPLRLTTGSHHLTLAADGTLSPAITTGAGGDTRALSVRLHRWRWRSALNARATR